MARVQLAHTLRVCVCVCVCVCFGEEGEPLGKDPNGDEGTEAA